MLINTWSEVSRKKTAEESISERETQRERDRERETDECQDLETTQQSVDQKQKWMESRSMCDYGYDYEWLSPEAGDAGGSYKKCK